MSVLESEFKVVVGEMLDVASFNVECDSIPFKSDHYCTALQSKAIRKPAVKV